MLSIVRNGGTTGYYVDIFRSKKQRKGDKFHDYFYHNLGQEMKITDVADQPLVLKPREEMAFAGGHLFALDYMWDKKSVTTDKDYKAEWKMNMQDGDHVYMNLWMKGYPGREVFSIKSPPTKAFRKDEHGIPYDVENAPFLPSQPASMARPGTIHLFLFLNRAQKERGNPLSQLNLLNLSMQHLIL